MSVSVAYKPSSVFGGHLSRPIVAEGFKRNPESLTGRLKRSFVSCSEWGLHRGRVARPRVSSYLTFPPLHIQRYAVSLCCTFPGVAPAGRYPASCPMQLGLSSHLAARGRPAASQTRWIITLFYAVVNAKADSPAHKTVGLQYILDSEKTNRRIWLFRL